MQIRALALALLALAVVAVPAGAKPYLPPAGKVWNGVTGNVRPVGNFASQTGKHPAVWQFFTNWGDATNWWFPYAQQARMRPMVHITTGALGHERISPGGIAAGRGDSFLIGLNRSIAASGQITYVRLMAEMDGYWNPYSAFNQNGSSRGRAHSTAAFRQAWRRCVVIVRGGPIAAIDKKLKQLHMPAVQGAGGGSLAHVPVAFMWVPQVAGAPDTAANAPSAYWPGAEYVDWVGTDFYSKFPNWAGLERFYAHSYGKPFVFGEWALWGSDNPGFVHQLFGWARSHKRVRMLTYNQGNRASGPFQLRLYPHGRAQLLKELGSSRFPAYAPELAP